MRDEKTAKDKARRPPPPAELKRTPAERAPTKAPPILSKKIGPPA